MSVVRSLSGGIGSTYGDGGVGRCAADFQLGWESMSNAQDRDKDLDKRELHGDNDGSVVGLSCVCEMMCW